MLGSFGEQSRSLRIDSGVYVQSRYRPQLFVGDP